MIGWGAAAKRVPWRAIALIVFVGAMLAGVALAVRSVYEAGAQAGAAAERQQCQAVKDAIDQATEAFAAKAAGNAEAIGSQGEQALRRVLAEVRKNRQVYVDCRHPPEAFRALNEALVGRPAPAASGVKP